MNSDFLLAIRQIEREREIPPEEIQTIIEDALVRAIQQEAEDELQIRVEFDINTGRITILRVREVVEEVENPSLEVSLADATRLNEEAQIGDLVETPVPPRSFRRIGIQKVKQHIIDRVKEMEKSIQVARFADKEGEIITGVVNRITSSGVLVNLDKVDALLPREERIPGENYQIGKRLKALILEVRTGGSNGGDIILSRSHPDFVKKLFQIEVPEISQNIVQVRAIVREAGYRTKMAVISTQDKVDPVGACVGYKGSRVKNIVNELNGEKIDIIPWDDQPAQFIAHALSPAQVISVEVFEDDHSAEVIVPESQLSLAIGKQGQNARLANKLTTWKIEILSDTEKDKLLVEMRVFEVYERMVTALGFTGRILTALADAGVERVYHLLCMTEDEVSAIPGLGEKSVLEIKSKLIELGFNFLEPGAQPPDLPPALRPVPEPEPEPEPLEGSEENESDDAEAVATDEFAPAAEGDEYVYEQGEDLLAEEPAEPVAEGEQPATEESADTEADQPAEAEADQPAETEADQPAEPEAEQPAETEEEIAREDD